MRTFAPIATLIPFTLLSSAALGQPIVLEDIVVSANRAATPAAQTGSAVSVLTDSTFEEDGRPFALDYLAKVPGLAVQQNGPPGTVSGFAVRGAPQQYVRVQIDGIEISDPTGPQVAPSLSGLLIDDISRIEVLRGSQSALYGGQAVAGVIDITTPRPTENGIENRYLLEGGSYDSFRGRYTLAGRSDRGDIAFTLARYQTDGFSAAEEADGNTEDDGYETTRLSTSGTFYATDQLSIFGSAFYQKEDGDYDAGPGPGGEAPNTFEGTSWALRGGAEFSFEQIENRISISYYDVDRTQTNAFGPFTTDGGRTRAEYLGSYRVSDALGFQFSTDYTRETSESNFSGGEESNWIAGLFGQADWSPVDELTLNAALRLDHHSEFGNYPTGRLTAAYEVTADTILRGSLGTGFRAPSNYELFDGFSGEPTLEPETSQSADVGIEHSLVGGRGRIGATLFYLRIDDLIEFDNTSFTYFQSDGTSESSGLELSAAWNITERLEISGAYTYTDAEQPDGSRRNRIPRHDLSLFLDGYATERLSFGVGAQLVGDYIDDSVTIASAGFKEDYVVVNARAAYALSEMAQLYVRASNLLDQQYQTARGFGTADSSVYVGVSGNF